MGDGVIKGPSGYGAYDVARFEYNEAAKNRSDAAFIHMLVNAFAESRNSKLTFDEAGSLVLKNFKVSPREMLNHR